MNDNPQVGVEWSSFEAQFLVVRGWVFRFGVSQEAGVNVMKSTKTFQILLLMTNLSLLVGCGAKFSTEWKMAFYKLEAPQTEFVMDYKECHVSAHSKGMLKSGVPIRVYIWYEWLEEDRANIYMTYHAQSEYLTTAYEKRKIFISEYAILLKNCMEEKGWTRRTYRQGDGGIYFFRL